MEIEQFRYYTGTVRSRRERDGKPWPLKPEGEELEGMRVTVQASWEIEPDDSRYPGEWAMTLYKHHPEASLTWIASGDLVDLELVRD